LLSNRQADRSALAAVRAIRSPLSALSAQHGRVRWGFAAGLSPFGGGARPHAEAAPRALSSTGHAVRMRKGGLGLARRRKIARHRARRAAPSHHCHAFQDAVQITARSSPTHWRGVPIRSRS
jgi:hypothetical protein